MKIAYISTYPPRQCGIGTFTNNLLRAVGHNIDSKSPSDHAIIVAINDSPNEYDYPEEVKYVIRQDQHRDYVDAARFINFSGADICILEHEFGLFGGDMGVYILPLIHRLEIPLIVTFHTVLKEPNNTQKMIVQQIADKASRITVMSRKAIELLKSAHNIRQDKLALIPHGFPSYDIPPSEIIRKKFKFNGRKVIFTFGLISRNKGIETVIKALPKVAEKHPEVLYVVLGNTHPGVLKHSGEEYRNYLLHLVRENNLGNNVFLQKQFIDEQTLFQYLTAIDVYVTPYHNEEQITSGTLSYAVGAGCAIVSTPYWHAQELLADGRGELFGFKDSDQLAEILISLFDNPEQVKQLREKTYKYGKKFRWNSVGKEYLDLSDSILEVFKKPKIDKIIIDPTLLPDFTLEHIKLLTDDTGIIQHTLYGIPNLKEGYCIDDVSRALLLTTMAYRLKKDPVTDELLPIYLRFIHYMQRDDGYFRNFLSFNRQYLDEIGSEDSFGRTIWSLGYLIKYTDKESYHDFAQSLFLKAKPNFDKLLYQRGIANAIIGISYYLQRYPDDEEITGSLKVLTDKLLAFYRKHSEDNWDWFEDVVTYDNGILPLALLHSYEKTGDIEVLTVAKKTINFLESYTLNEGYLTPIGNDGWFRKGGKCPVYAQQSIDVMAMVLLFSRTYAITKDKDYLEKMFISYLWYLGKNELNLSLYNYETNACYDGLESYGVNQNQGAESTLAYLISHLTVLRSIEFKYRPIRK